MYVAIPLARGQLTAQPAGVAGWLGPYSKPAEFNDPWGNPVQYRVPGEGRPFDLISLGADGQPGGESYNADIRYE